MKTTSLLLGFHVLLGSLLPRADYHELAKVPELYAHYQLHQQRSHGQLSLANFLLLHYADRQHQRSENHEKLPFQSSHACTGVILFFLVTFDFEFQSLRFATKAGYCLIPRFISSFSSGIFQPPKI